MGLDVTSLIKVKMIMTRDIINEVQGLRDFLYASLRSNSDFSTKKR